MIKYKFSWVLLIKYNKHIRVREQITISRNYSWRVQEWEWPFLQALSYFNQDITTCIMLTPKLMSLSRRKRALKHYEGQFAFHSWWRSPLCQNDRKNELNLRYSWTFLLNNLFILNWRCITRGPVMAWKLCLITCIPETITEIR